MRNAARDRIVELLDGIGTLVEWITMLLTGVLVMIVSANVFARYVLQAGLLWAEEVSRLTFVWVVFLGAYVALRQRAHLAITFVTNRVPDTWRKVIRIAGTLLTFLFLGVVIRFGIVLAMQTWKFGRVTPILGISAAWGYLSVPLAALLMFLETVKDVIMGGVLEPDEPVNLAENMPPADNVTVDDRSLA